MYHIDTELSLTEITSFQEQKKQVVWEIDCLHKTKVPRTTANCKRILKNVRGTVILALLRDGM